MIVFDLRCGAGHVFEAWFGSSADWEGQRARGLVSCPLCGDADIAKAVMAPAVPRKGNASANEGELPMAGGSDDARRKALIAALAQAQARALEGSDWVGGDFARRARAMHEGEEDHRPIHGQATLDEARSLVDDGVAVAPLPLPIVPPDAKN